MENKYALVTDMWLIKNYIRNYCRTPFEIIPVELMPPPLDY
jgi:hypothetical protein